MSVYKANLLDKLNRALLQQIHGSIFTERRHFVTLTKFYRIRKGRVNLVVTDK